MTLAQVATPWNWGDGWKWFAGIIVGGICAIFVAGQVYGGIVTRLDNVVNNTAKIETKVELAVANQTLQHDLIVGVQGNIKSLENGVVGISAEQGRVKEALVKTRIDTDKLAATAAEQYAESLERRAVNLPRIDKLEASQRLTDTAIAILTTKLEDIKGLAADTKTIVQSHDKDIRATRNAVAPAAPH